MFMKIYEYLKKYKPLIVQNKIINLLFIIVN